MKHVEWHFRDLKVIEQRKCEYCGSVYHVICHTQKYCCKGCKGCVASIRRREKAKEVRELLAFHKYYE